MIISEYVYMKKLIVIIMILMFALSCGKSEDAKTSADVNIPSAGKGFVEKLKAEHAGKVLIVNFFASWCPPCRGETPDFVAAYEKHKDNGFVIVGLSVDKKLSDAAKFVSEYNITYPVYHADQALGAEMNIGTIPTSMIYKPDGKLFDIIVGPISAKELDIIAGSFK
jgi:thiol-disulfide isomerase/thioredoxin